MGKIAKIKNNRTALRQSGTALNRNGTMHAIRRDYQLYLMLVPVLIYYIIFMYKPMYGLQIAFKDYSLFKGIADSPWCGFKHFINFFNGPFFFRTFRNTLLISIYGLLANMPAQIILALLFNELKTVLSSGLYRQFHICLTLSQQS